MSTGWIIFLGLGYGLSLVVLPFMLLSDKQPSGVLAWIWAVLLFPYLGPLAYLLFGSDWVYRRHLGKRVQSLSQLRNKHRESWPQQTFAPEVTSFSALLSTINLFPASTHETATLYLRAQSFYEALEASILEAEQSIHIEFFIWRQDTYGEQMLHLLVAAARRGVKIRLLVDEMGSIEVSHGFFQPLVDVGGEFSWFNTVDLFRNRWAFSLRNHRKFQVFDGKIAYVGGMNLGREYAGENPACGEWKDVQVRLTGEIVDQLQRTFTEDWHFATGQEIVQTKADEGTTPSPHPGKLAQLIEDGPDTRRTPMILSTTALLNQAQDYIWFTAGYFYLDEPLLSSIKLCAARGVEVRILVAAKSEHPYLVSAGRTTYEELMDYGVKIYEYTDGTHHAKVIISDDRWTSIGSANLDVRSMRLNFELNVLLLNPEITGQIKASLDKDFTASKIISLESFQQRSWRPRLVEKVCRLLGPIL